MRSLSLFALLSCVSSFRTPVAANRHARASAIMTEAATAGADAFDCRGDNCDAEKYAASASYKPNAATDVDALNFFGASGGGELTREGIANAQKTRSKTIDALDALQEAVQVTGSLAPALAAEELQRVIGAAYEAGVRADAPQMKRAASLLTALEAAGEASASAEEKGLEDKLDSIFGGGYAPPE